MKKSKKGRRALSLLLAFSMVMGSYAAPVQAAAGPVVDSGEDFLPGTADNSMEWTEKTMEISDYCFGSGFTEYDTYYYTDGINYTYKGEEVTFVSESEITAGGTTYPLKNKKTEVTVTSDEEGTVSVSLSDISRPVVSIPGEWNSNSGGMTQAVYQTDIPGMGEVRTAEKAALTFPLVLEQVPAGTWHLSLGAIYEKANSYSPGHDFRDGSGKVKERFFGVLPDISFTVKDSQEEEEKDSYLGVKTEAKVYDDFENDIWLQYQQKDLEVGETASLYPWRMEQIITDTINNDVVRPEFHFEIIAGDSISLSTEASDQKAIVTAEKPGTSVVKVTYDAMDYKGKHWGAISDVNTAYAVYTVGEDGTAKIITNEEFENWRHYDTVYYSKGETTPYTFTVDTEGAKSVKVTVNGMTVEGNGNTYTADLENRSNIIGIRTKDADGKVKSMYRVIDARFIKIQAANKTNPGETIKAGDTATISFKGITMPVYKLATVYNPQMGGGTWVGYRNAQLGDFKGKCSQWDLATKNSFDVTFEEEGEYLFYSENGIYCAWWGSDLGTDMTMEGQGKPNTNANTVKDWFSSMPDFVISVAESDDAGSIDAGKVSKAISDLPETEKMTLRDKKAVEAARKLYEKLSQSEKEKVTNLETLKTAEEKTQELLKTPFLFSLDKEILSMANTGKENGHGGYYYKVAVPDETDRIQLERYKELEVLDQSGQVVTAAGTMTVDVKDIEIGENNYIVLKEKDSDVCHYVYFSRANIGYTVSPEVIYPGTKVTVTLKNLVAPETSPAPVHNMYTSYTTDIPGCETVRSVEAKDNEEKLSVLTVTVPEDAGTGVYHMTNGHVYKKWGGYYIQGVILTGTKEAKFYEEDMPEIEIEVTDEDHLAAEKVMNQIDALGEITSLSQEPEVLLARAAYDALTEKQQVLVTNLETLTAAEAKIEQLKQIPEEDGYVTVDIERFSIGQGFYREPVRVKFEAGETVKDILKRLEGENMCFNTTETYLSGIKGADAGTGIKVPEYISEKLDGPTTEEAEAVGNRDDILGEFDYYQGSGWYYFVNNEAPDLGIAEYCCKPGDVIRVQFTLLWGADLTGVLIGVEGEEPAVVISDKDEALVLLAEVNGREDKETLLKDQKIKAAYDAVEELVQDAVSAQEDIDKAVQDLKEALEKEPGEPENPDEPKEPGEPENPDEPKEPQEPENPDEKEVTLTNRKYGICLTGKGLTEDMELAVKPLDIDSKEVALIRKEIPSTKGVTKLYDVKLMQDGEEIEVPEGCVLSLNVNEKYNDKEMSMLFCVNGKVKEVKGRVKDGLLSVPFEKNAAVAMVVDLETKPGDNGSNGNGTGGNTSSGVKTGDEAPLEQMLALLAVSGCIIALVLRKRRREPGR